MTPKSFQGYGTGNWSAGELSERWWREERNGKTHKYSNLSPSSLSLSLSLSLSPLSLFLPRSALAPQICVTKWTYNWKSGGPEILLTFPLSRLHISSGELRGWCEHMGRRWGEEKVIRRSLLLLFVGDFLILYTFFFLFLPCFFFSDLYFLPNTSIFSSPATMFLIIVCLFTFVILCGHPWWYHRVPGHCVHACVCACVCVCVCVCVDSEHPCEAPHTHADRESESPICFRVPISSWWVLRVPHCLSWIGHVSGSMNPIMKEVKSGQRGEKRKTGRWIFYQKMYRHCPLRRSTSSTATNGLSLF